MPGDQTHDVRICRGFNCLAVESDNDIAGSRPLRAENLGRPELSGRPSVIEPKESASAIYVLNADPEPSPLSSTGLLQLTDHITDD